MKKNNLIRLLQSLAMVPMMTMPVMFMGGPGLGIASNVLVQKFNIEVDGTVAPNQAPDPQTIILKARAEAIDAYFRERNMPLEGTGMTMVQEAQKNNLDWRLLAAIAVRESTGGKFECKKADFNAFGWGSCKIDFESNEHAIEIVAKNLGGNNPNTARHYQNKTTMQILRAYNPPSVVKKYAQQVVSIMNAIGTENLADIEITNTPNA